jgi:phosphomannomutase
MLDDIAAAAAGASSRTPVGEANVIAGDLAKNAVIGGEGNGGVIDPRIVRAATASSAWRTCCS